MNSMRKKKTPSKSKGLSKEPPLKAIETLIPDIYSLFDKGADLSKDGIAAFATTISSIISDRFASYKEPRKNHLRMSNIGKNPLQLWYDINGTHSVPTTTPSDKLKFLFGDIIEALILFLASEAGHAVTRQQEEVRLEGIVGHLDAFIDGELTDVKSASKYAFNKFQSEQSLRADDSFGYVEQLSGYGNATDRSHGFFVVCNKESGELQLCKLRCDDVRPRIKDLKNILAQPEPPFKCTNDQALGLSGNRSLSYPCTYCTHKHECWRDANGGEGLKAYEYSTGTKYLTHVAQEPRVNKKETNV